jgi:3D (Asp-Asp-Asp) domain-containing protein
MIRKLKIERTIFLICLIICLLTLIISGLQAKAMQGEIEELEYQNSRQAAQLKDKDYQIKILEIILENRELDASEPMSTEPEYLGTFTVTHYCPCEICCGKTDGITFTGTQATEGRTIAVDPDVIPLGSTVVIDGQEYVAEDVGGAIRGMRIDKYMDNHQEALDAGIVQAEVWIGG